MFKFLKGCIFGFPHEKFSATLFSDITKLELKKSDVLVLSLDFIASATQKNQIKFLFENCGIDNEIILIENGMKITVLSK